MLAKTPTLSPERMAPWRSRSRWPRGPKVAVPLETWVGRLARSHAQRRVAGSEARQARGRGRRRHLDEPTQKMILNLDLLLLRGKMNSSPRGTPVECRRERRGPSQPTQIAAEHAMNAA